MSFAKDNPTTCAAEGCDASHPTSYWHNIKADKEGWFHQKDGTAWCPQDRPEWVDDWRNR